MKITSSIKRIFYVSAFGIIFISGQFFLGSNKVDVEEEIAKQIEAKFEVELRTSEKSNNKLSIEDALELKNIKPTQGGIEKDKLESLIKGRINEPLKGRQFEPKTPEGKRAELNRLDELYASTKSAKVLLNSSGQPKAIYPKYTQSVESHDAFIKESAKLLDLNVPGSSLNVTRENRCIGNQCVSRYQRMAFGVPVLFSDMTLTTVDGKVISMTGALNQPNISKEMVENGDVLSEAELLEVAQSKLLGQWQITKSTYGIYESTGGAAPAYEVELRSGFRQYDMVIHAGTKTILNENDRLKHSTNASGLDLRGQRREFSTIPYQGRNYLRDTRLPSGASTTVYDAFLAGITGRYDNTGRPIYFDNAGQKINYISQYGFSTNTMVSSASTDSGWNSSAVSVISHFDTLFNYFSDTHGYRFGETGAEAQPIRLIVDIEFETQANAFNLGTIMGFGKTSDTNYADSFEVVGHELGHGIVGDLAGLRGNGWPDTLNESFSDLFGVLASPQAGWGVGDDSPNAVVRSMSNPSSFGGAMYYRQYDPNVSIYTNAGISNYFFYLIAEGLTSDNLGVSIGRGPLAQIAFGTLSSLSSRAEFNDVYNGMVAKAEELHGEGSTEVQAIERAAEVIGYKQIADNTETTVITKNSVFNANGRNITAFVSANYITNAYDLYLQYFDSDEPIFNEDNVIRFEAGISAYAPAITTVNDGEDEASITFYKKPDGSVHYIEFDADANIITDEYFPASAGQYISQLQISSDFKYIAFSYTDAEESYKNIIGLYSIDEDELTTLAPTLPIYTENTNGLSVEYIDAIDFDPTNRRLVFDYLACEEDTSSEFADNCAWRIGVYDIISDTYQYPFARLQSNVDVGNPSFANVSSDFIVFDVFYDDYDISEIWTLNTNTGEAKSITASVTASVTRVNFTSRPSFTQDDSGLVFSVRQSDDFPDGYLYHQPISDYDDIEGDNGEYLNAINSAIFPITASLNYVDARPSLTLSSTAIDFGDITTVAQSTVCLSNSTTYPIQIYSVKNELEALNLAAIPNYVSSGEQHCLPIAIDVTDMDAGDFSQDVRLVHDARNSPSIITVSGAKVPDYDNDGIPDATDPDDDNDGAADVDDAFPFDATETEDTDNDGIGNNIDTDDDNDGVSDTLDTYPLVAIGNFIDTDSDGAPDECDDSCLALGMEADDDDDGDGVLDTADAYPLISLEGLADNDRDGAPDSCDENCIELGMTADNDDDNDFYPDENDSEPLNPEVSFSNNQSFTVFDSNSPSSNVNLLASNTLLETITPSSGSETWISYSGDFIANGKHYWEVTAKCGGDTLGASFSLVDQNLEVIELTQITTDGARDSDGNYYLENFEQTAADDVFMFAVNMENKTYFIGKNGTWFRKGEPSFNKFPLVNNLPEKVKFKVQIGSRECQPNKLLANFGHTDFSYEPPLAYFKGYCTNNSCEIFEGVDTDNDGIVDQLDKFPLIDIGSLFDTDSDGAPDNCDEACMALGMTADDDDDGDGVLDVRDEFPLISFGNLLDSDGDGIPNECDQSCLTLGLEADNDDDNDGIIDLDDAFPTVSLNLLDNLGLSFSESIGFIHDELVWMRLDLAKSIISKFDAGRDDINEYAISKSLYENGILKNWRHASYSEFEHLIKSEIGNNINIDITQVGTGLFKSSNLNKSQSLRLQEQIGLTSTVYNDGAQGYQFRTTGHLETNEGIEIWGEIVIYDYNEISFVTIRDRASQSNPDDSVGAGSWLVIPLDRFEPTLRLDDSDGDGIPDDCFSFCATLNLASDTDDDNDGVLDTDDLYPFIAIGNLIDTDSDGAPDTCDETCFELGMTADRDDDNDGLKDTKELAINLDPLNSDSDNDGVLDSDEQVSFELISTFPELSFKMHRIDNSLDIENAYIRLVTPSQCYVETSFNDKSDDVAQLTIPLHENAISGDYQVSIQSASINEKLSFSIDNPEQDTTVPQMVDYDVSANSSSDIVEVLLQISGMDSGFGVDDPWINSTRLTHTVHVGDAPSNYVGNVSDLDDVELTGDTYKLKTRHDLSNLASTYTEAPTVNYVRICEQSYNGIEYTIDTDGDNAVDEFDIAPKNPAVWIDVDKDGKDNSIDNCPLTANTEQLDFDIDGTGDVCDTDDDNDGLNDDLDAFPLDSFEQTDSDNDGLGDNYELFNNLDRLNPDFDSDGLKDGAEIELGTNPKLADSDDDGVIDGKDKFPLISIGDLVDTDSDGAPDECDEACLTLGMTADRDGIPAYTYIESENFTFATLTPTAKVIVTGSQGENFFDIARYVDTVSMVGQTFLVSGSSSIDGFRVMPGVKYDLTNLKGSVDTLYFSGPLSEYAGSILLDSSTGVMQLSRLTDIGEEIVQFIGSNTAADVLVFSDGAISTLEVKDAVLNNTDLTTLTLDTSVSAMDDKVTTGAQVKHIILDNDGTGAMALGPNIQTLISGSSGVDQIYVPEGSVVDASNLKSGQDEVYVQGELADYNKALDPSGNIILTREVTIDTETYTESITVASGGNVATNDLVIFADQQLDTASLRLNMGN